MTELITAAAEIAAKVGNMKALGVDPPYYILIHINFRGDNKPFREELKCYGYKARYMVHLGKLVRLKVAPVRRRELEQT